MNNNKSALILVDCQNDLLTENGVLFSAVNDNHNIKGVLRNINRSIATAREQGMPVIFTSLCFSEDYSELGGDTFGILATVKQSGSFVSNTWGAKIADGIDCKVHDLVIEKSSMCAFKQTNLTELLRDLCVERLIFGGLVTNLCLETSVRSAYDLGYEVIALEDCMASINHAAHVNSVRDNFPMFSKLSTHDTFASELPV